MLSTFMLRSLSVSLLIALDVSAQLVTLSGSNSPSSSISIGGGDVLPTGSQVTYPSDLTTSLVPTSDLTRTSIAVPSTITSGSLSGSTTILLSSIAAANESSSSPSSSPSVSLLSGSIGATSSSSPASNATAAGNLTTSSTSTSAAPTNTQPCNNYPELCSRKYSNITEVGAHNSPFINPNNAAANQAFGVITQLDDGIRMLQGQTHRVNDTMYYCHTSCDLLNAGTAEEYFTNITSWVRNHPYDVITILIGNGDFVGVLNFTAPLENSGLAEFAYIPPKIPMALEDWPTLTELILRRKRVVIFMDYQANQTQVPYILDEFSHMWETPFSPTDRTFPCTVQRPPGLNENQTNQRLYMANHNLNTQLSFGSANILIPAFPLLNVTNNVTGNGSLGVMTNNCVEAHVRPPNFLLVDYYNIGGFNGSVFEVAAMANNVIYNRKCCGYALPSSAQMLQPVLLTVFLMVGLSVLLQKL